MAHESILGQPRYKERPALLLFEFYVLDCIDQLPDEKIQALGQMNLQQVFTTQSTHWKDVLREQMQLSDTLDIAIQDAWRQEKADIDAIAFSQSFADKYFAEGSRIDVWEKGGLEAAKKRIQSAQ